MFIIQKITTKSNFVFLDSTNMDNKISTNVYSNFLYIWSLKFNIISSVIKISLKNSFIVLFKFNFFTLGISIFSYTYYVGFFNGNSKEQYFTHFIHNNVPGVYLTSTSISWQTFQKTQFFPQKPISYIDKNINEIPKPILIGRVLENKLFQETTKSFNYWGEHLQFKFTPKWNSYKKQYFFGLKTNSNELQNENQDSLKTSNWTIFSARDNVTSSNYECIVQNKINRSQNIHLFQKNYYVIDEYPLSLKQTHQLKSQETLKTELDLDNQKNLRVINLEKTVTTNTNQKLYKAKKAFLIAIKSKNAISAEDIKLIKSIPTNSSSETSKRLKNLQIQLKQFFYKKNNIFDSFGNIKINKNINNIFKQSEFNHIASNQILFLITKANSHNKYENNVCTNLQINYNNKLFSVREMSGFNYPDLTNEDVFNLAQKSKYYKKLPQYHLSPLEDQINVLLGSHFSYPVYHQEEIQTPSKVKFKYNPIRLDALDGTLYYSGPGVLIKPNNFDQIILNFDNLKNNLQGLFDYNNPRKLTLLRSFQKSPIDLKIILDPVSKEKADLSLFEKTKNDQYSFGFQKLKEISSERQPIDSHVDYGSQYIVAKLPNSKSWFNQNTPSIIIKTRLVNSFPVKQISFITSSNFYSLFDILDYQNPIETLRQIFALPIEKNKKVEFYELNQEQSAFSTQFTRQALINIGYFKKFHPYSGNEINNQKSNLYQLQKFNGTTKNQLYEPIHTNSWLMVNQYLFALFIAYILSQLTKEYGRELVSYLVDLISSLGIFDESFKEELTGDGSSSGYRLINKPNKKFKDIAGVEHIFSDLSEIIWFLRNSGRSFNVGNILSKGILLIGPPGTGKTLLVQTIAGEAQVPVLVQSASSLNSIEGLGAQRLQNLFHKAKQLSPCVIFFDEIDSIGQRRMHIIEDTAQTSKLIQIISSNDGIKPLSETSFIPFAQIHKEKNQLLETNPNSEPQESTGNGNSSEQLGLLMQLLIELDGLQSARRVIIIGATNRPNVLDPALTRPGRLDKVFKLGLPDKEKRIEICQLYSKILGFSSIISWDYIGNQTFGLSGADLAAIVNQSAIQAILSQTKHTMETFDIAIDKITGENSGTKFIESKQMKDFSSNYLPLTRFAYYHSGLAISQLVIKQLKSPILCSILPIEKNERYNRMVQKLLSSQFTWSQRFDLELKLISIYSGKILELLYLGQNLSSLNTNLAQSDLGKKELLKATNLVYLLTSKWFLYSQNLVQDKSFYFLENKNKNEILEPQIFNFLNDLLKNSQLSAGHLEQAKYQNFQRWITKSWWQSKISNENASFTNAYADWYRIYVTNPDETETNDEWIPPDRYFHSNHIYLLTRTIHLNDFYKNRRDFAYKALLEKSITRCFRELQIRPEFNDFFVMHLIQKQQLRQDEMENIYLNFF